ncbi:helix-turn-helix domain-containing protein [uncultured Demequina sp.]|uniref:helix-turn-helix domain-containing protein n=1 Tax=uncultured Demequina sp. TaxID=693499 RepID=UPI0025DF6C70|nr:helix-turn-helix domain-containing protein [uncultured Demequina sp.]
MSRDRAHLLLHPVRMRVMIALGNQELTTQQIGLQLGDVPQASLYRAVAALHEAGILEVVDEVPRGGALERIYRTVPEQAVVSRGDFTSGTQEEFLGTVQVFADLLVSTTAGHLAKVGDDWRDYFYGMRHGTIWLDKESREELSADLQAVFAKYAERGQPEGTEPWALMMAAIPDPMPAVGGEDDAEAEASAKED